MAQLTSVRLRVRADNSIDRRCSTDTAYPFQPLPGQADPYTGPRGWLSSPLDSTGGGGSSGRGMQGGARWLRQREQQYHHHHYHHQQQRWWRCSILRP